MTELLLFHCGGGGGWWGGRLKVEVEEKCSCGPWANVRRVTGKIERFISTGVFFSRKLEKKVAREKTGLLFCSSEQAGGDASIMVAKRGQPL